MIVGGEFVISGADLATVERVVVIGEGGAQLAPQSALIVKDDSTAAQTSLSLAVSITDVVEKVLLQSLVLIDGVDYDITGEIIPVGATVKLSRAAVGTDYDTLIARLTDAQVASTTAASDGTFSFPGVDVGGDYTVWAEIPIESADDINAAMVATATANVPPSGEVVQCIDIAATPENITGLAPDEAPNPNQSSAILSLAGELPTGTTNVYLSKGDSEDYGELVNTIRAQSTAAAGRSFIFHEIEVNWGAHTLWIRSASTVGFSAKITYLNGKICLAGETLITMADGTTRRLDELVVGDLVMAGDGRAVKVTRTEHGDLNDSHTLYTFADGTVIDEIHAHRFYNADQGFFQVLGRWQLGERALRQDGQTVALVSVEHVDEPKQMFGLWTESHDYFANGLLSGETMANQRLIATATAEQAAAMAASLGEGAALALIGEKGLFP